MTQSQRSSSPPESPSQPQRGSSEAASGFDAAACSRVLQTIADETVANLAGLRRPGSPRPYYISNLLRHQAGSKVRATYGAVFQSREWQKADLFSDVRVGSYRLDQVLDGGLDRDPQEDFSTAFSEAPLDLGDRGLRYALWKLMQLRYEEALGAYYDKRKVMVEQRLPRSASFSHEERLEWVEPVEPLRFPTARWEEEARRVSEVFTRHAFVFDPQVSYWGNAQTRFFASSEGSRFVSRDSYYQLSIQAWVRGADGIYVPGGLDWYGRAESELPGVDEALAAAEELVVYLEQLQQARPLGAYVGPALLSGQAAAVFFHEAVGHRLEGERLVSRREGKTFLGKLGERILPEYIHLEDDPTRVEIDGKPLFGHFRVDDQGVAPERTPLVEAGRLVGYLKSRLPVPGSPRSNGHARAEGVASPMARMGSLIARSEQQHTWDELVELLRAECRRQKKRDGLIIERVVGGETSTDAYDFQSFKGEPSRVWLVSAATGKRRLVRDVSFIGTPLAALQKILAAGKQLDVDNGYCGAESGEVPVSNVAPPLLLSELELQRKSTHAYHDPSLPLPWHR